MAEPAAVGISSATEVAGKSTTSMRRPIVLGPGQRLGRYEILGEIGAGGMATVYRARDLELGRVVALKVLPPSVTLDDRFVSRFLAEARAVARLSHQHIVQVHDIGQDRGAWYISMEMIAGANLSDYLREATPNLHQSVQIALQVAEAIDYTHKHGIMHRDLKPSNVLMRDGQPVVIDFGLSKDLNLQNGAVLTNDGEMIGSPAYMSPEQARGGEVDTSTDICSLGILLYELISFKNPYLDPRSIHQTVLNVIAADPVPIRQLCPWVDRELAAVVAKAMARRKEDRYPSMGDFARDLRNWTQGLPVSARPPGLSFHLRRFIREKALYLWIGGITVAFGCIGLGYVKLQERLSHTPWTPFAQESFDTPTAQIAFESFDVGGTANSPVAIPSKSWGVDKGRLVGSGKAMTFVRSQQEFLGNIRVEFEVTGLEGTNHDFNIFLYGDNPWNGYCFYLGQWGSGRSGIDDHEVPYRWLPAGVPLQADRTYKVAIERDGQRLSLLVDGVVVDERIRVLPPSSTGGYRLGFFTWNGKVAIDNIKVSRKTVALKADPTVVADAFLDEGLLDHAINSYQAVVASYPTHEIAQQAQLKLGTILLQRSQYKQAIDLFETVSRDALSKDLKVQALFLLSIAQQSVGNLQQSQEYQERLIDLDTRHPANVALIQNQLDRIEYCLDLSQPMFQGCAGEGEAVFRFLAKYQPTRQGLFGPVHVRFIEALRLWNDVMGSPNFLLSALQFSQYYKSKSPEIAAQIELVKARFQRDRREDAEAQALLREIATGPDSKDASHAALEAAIELGSTLAWEGKSEQADEWFRKVIENPDAPERLVDQALFESGINAVLSGKNAAARWKEILDRAPAVGMLRAEAAYLRGDLSEAAFHDAMATPEGLRPDYYLVKALARLQKRDIPGWRDAVDEFVRHYPYAPSMWEMRRVVQWASQRTPLPNAGLRQARGRMG